MAYYKVRIEVWCDWNPAESDLEEIAQNTSIGEAICSKQEVGTRRIKSCLNPAESGSGPRTSPAPFQRKSMSESIHVARTKRRNISEKATNLSLLPASRIAISCASKSKLRKPLGDCGEEMLVTDTLYKQYAPREQHLYLALRVKERFRLFE